jgi:hypothetical protein
MLFNGRVGRSVGALLALFLAVRPVFAAEGDSALAASGVSPVQTEAAFSLVPDAVWINPGVLSYHFNRNAGYREDNWGIGGQLDFPGDISLLGGTFINSDNRRSHDVGLLWEPLHLGIFKFGGVAGGFDGYPYMLNGAWFPALLPMASTSYGRFGANLTVVPNYKNRLHGAVVLQLMFRIW